MSTTRLSWFQNWQRHYCAKGQKIKFFDRIELNRWFFQLNGNLLIYPWKFLSSGSYAVSRTTAINIIFNIQMALCGLYALYVQWTLARTIIHGVDSRRYDVFGMHFVRSLLAACFAYWGYEFFVAHTDEHKLLYNFVQLGPGNTFLNFCAAPNVNIY